MHAILRLWLARPISGRVAKDKPLAAATAMAQNVVHLSRQKAQKSKMKRKLMGMTEASWLMLETKNRPMHVASLLVYSLPKGAPKNYLRDLVSELRETTEFADPFNRKLFYPELMPFVTAIPFWGEDHDLDLEYHVRHLSLPEPGGERELGILISRLHSNPMDLSRPLWEYHVIEGLENNRFAVYFRMHHSIVDGMSSIEMMQRSMSTDPKEISTPAIWSAAGAPIQSLSLREAAKQVSNSFKTVVPVTKKLLKVAESSLDSDDAFTQPFQAPKTILNGRLKSQRRFATQQYDFERIKALSKLGDCTINDIVLALCSGALRDFLRELQALPSKSLTAGIPISLRTANDSASPAVSFIVASLATNIADPLRRLEAIKASTRRAKEMLQDMSKPEIESFNNILATPQFLQTALNLEGRTRPVYNVIISNVPGPRMPLYFRGSKLEAMYPVSAVTHGQALNITCYSYAGTLTFGFAGCRDTLPRMQRLAVKTGKALNELEAALKANSPQIKEDAKASAEKKPIKRKAKAKVKR